MCLYKPSLTHTHTHAPRHRLYTSCASHLSSGHQPNRAPLNQCFLWVPFQMDAQINQNDFWENSVLSGWTDGVNLWWCFSSYSIERWGALLFPERASAPYLAERSKNLPNATYWCFAIVLRALRVERWNALHYIIRLNLWDFVLRRCIFPGYWAP